MVVIQSTDLVVSNGQAIPGRSGKVHTLYPGEMAWDPIAASGPRVIRVYDKQKNVVHQDRVDCNKNDIFLSLQIVQPPAVRGQQQAAPQLKFLATVLPSQAPGILPRGSMPTNPQPQLPVPKPLAPPTPSPPTPRPPSK